MKRTPSSPCNCARYSSATSSFSAPSCPPHPTHSYTVLAFDVAGNQSARSVAASAATLAGGDTIQPVTTAPVQSMMAGSMILNDAISSSLPVRLSWSATDNVGVTGYELQESVNGGAFSTVTLLAHGHHDRPDHASS
jgi:hypothetical protein